jgi:hypothetical protein
MLALFVAEFASYHLSYGSYFYTYWAGSLITLGLEFLVLREIFHGIFRPYDSLRQLGDVLFKWAAMVLALVAVVCAATGPVDGRAVQMIVTLERSLRVMQVGLVLFLFLFAGHAGLTARSHIFGLALGFGIYATVQLGVATLWTLWGAAEHSQLNLLNSIAYNIACAVWLCYLRAPEPERLTRSHRARCLDWNRALQSINEPDQERFMPMVEDTVERVLQKSESETRVSK